MFRATLGTMAKRELWEFLRRRLAPLVIVLIVAMLGVRTCESDLADVEIRLRLGAASAQVQALRVDVFPTGDQAGVAYFERRYAAGRAPEAVSMSAHVDPGMYRVHIDATLVDDARSIWRQIEVRHQAVVTIDLRDALSNGVDDGAR